MQFRESKRTRRVLINITSLIDVLFLLLIFLMVSSTFLEQPGIQLDLPSAESATLVEQKEFTLFIDREGRVFLNQQETDLTTLEETLKKVLPEMKEGALNLKADKGAVYGVVVRVMDMAKKSGVKKLVIATKLNE